MFNRYHKIELLYNPGLNYLIEIHEFKNSVIKQPAKVTYHPIPKSVLKPIHYSIWPFAIALIIFTASSQSSLTLPSTGFSYDKLIHFLIFGLLATSIIRIPYLLNMRWKGVFIAILITSLYGIIDEYRQMHTAGRYVEFKDWLADTSGAALASILYFKWDWYSRLLEKKFFDRKASKLASN